MGYTSSEVKNRYNKKTYSNWLAAIRKEEFTQIEAVRAETGLSRAEFLKMLFKEKYGIDLDDK